MNDRMWIKIEAAINAPYYLDSSDSCFYAREYISGGGYGASQTNQLIINFKKHPSKRGTAEWKWKERAVLQFAEELSEILPENATIATIPPSKSAEDEEYDPRFEMLAEKLHAIRSDVVLESLLNRLESSTACHLGGDRTPSSILEFLEWTGFSSAPPSTLFIIDDVISSGAHFKACKRRIIENHTGIEVCGLFWARTVEPGSIPE